ncbi:MAG TPA: alpha/beta hydrolase, partial [Gemmatimonadaceae bacterium]|nr:alpha/beta hydrolase [Gemmatimonadaceae bacterium]
MSTTRESHGERSVALLDAGVWLHYVERGHDGSPVVFVHGGGKDHHYWRQQLAPFAEHHRVVAYSRRYAAPNHNAPIVPDYSATTDAEDLHELLRVLGLGPAHIVAASIGASAALFLAVRHPEVVRSLVLAEPPLLGLAREEPGGAELLNAFLTGAFFPAGAAFRAGDDERGMAILMDAFVAPGAFQGFSPERQHRVMRGARDWAAQTMSEAP